MAVKAQKKLEMKLHETFYKNVHLLTLVCPPNSDFKEVFKKDMFVKNNLAGFKQVIYYLLEILDGEKLKHKVPTWPPYDKVSEYQFRNEIVAYVNELNSIYEDANIPHLETSHVILPGGFKFIKFMLKLSKLALFESIKRNQNINTNMLLPIKSSKQACITTKNIERLETVTAKINKECKSMMTDFEDQLKSAKLEAENITANQFEVSELYKKDMQKLLQLKEELLKIDDVEFKEADLELEVQRACDKLKMIKENMEKVEYLNSVVSENQAKPEKSEEFKLPPEISSIVHVQDGKMDLSSLLESCTILIARKRPEIKPLNESKLLRGIKNLKDSSQQFSFAIEELDLINLDLVDLCKSLQDNKLKAMNSVDSSSVSSDSEELALPLPVTPSSYD